jgi:Putative DNA-binding domain
MNDGLMEQLLHEGESSSLDYKRDQYPFVGATDDEKGERLQDILVFANGWRHAEAYILIGVEEVAGGRSTVVGVSHHIPENDLQQLVNSKTNRPVTFSYRSYSFEGKQVGVISCFRAMRGGDWRMMRAFDQESTRLRSRCKDEMYFRFVSSSFSRGIRQGHIALMRMILRRRAPNLLSSHQLSSTRCPLICIRISSGL